MKGGEPVIIQRANQKLGKIIAHQDCFTVGVRVAK